MVLNYISITLGYQARHASSMIETLYNVVKRSPPGRDQKLTQFPPNHQKFQDLALSSTFERGEDKIRSFGLRSVYEAFMPSDPFPNSEELEGFPLPTEESL